jgi:hypothetical protein
LDGNPFNASGSNVPPGTDPPNEPGRVVGAVVGVHRPSLWRLFVHRLGFRIRVDTLVVVDDGEPL